MSYKFKIGDRGRTDKNRPYRVVCTNADSIFPIIILVRVSDNFEVPYSCDPDGKIDCLSEWVMPPTEMVTKWVNVSGRSGNWWVFETEEDSLQQVRRHGKVLFSVIAQPVSIEVPKS